MRLTVVRHGRAGRKQDWTAPDQLRPLDATGELQAKALANLLVDRPVGLLVSSPALRCVQTLQPLADEIDQPIETWDGLAPGAPVAGLAACLGDRAFANGVLCTHGEVMGPLLAHLALRGLVLPRGGRRALLTKGTAWRLTVSPRRGRIDLDHVVPTI